MDTLLPPLVMGLSPPSRVSGLLPSLDASLPLLDGPLLLDLVPRDALSEVLSELSPSPHKLLLLLLLEPSANTSSRGLLSLSRASSNCSSFMLFVEALKFHSGLRLLS